MLKKYTFLLIPVLLFLVSGKQEEGMFPLSSLHKLDLQKAGLEIPTSEIYNAQGNSLINALVRIDGCTGSFISDQGLIITNHHCVYGAVASLSSSSNNYLQNGFYASKKNEELKTGMTCRITQSYSDVSSEVLQGVEVSMDARSKMELIANNIAEVTKTEQEKFPNLKIEISEMLVGKSYTLFRYKTLTDVRIVYVPPASIGKFGGEMDNWEWPRHNGDFSIVRAYENDKPYIPARSLQVANGGTKEGDFAFILGYPGRTYRNQPAQFLAFEQKFVLPIISDWYYYRINAIQQYIKGDTNLQLAYAGTLASLNNTAKNFKGKMQGLQRTDVVEKAFKEQNYLRDYALSNASLAEYVGYFDDVEKFYHQKSAIGSEYLHLTQLYRSSSLFTGAAYLSKYKNALGKLSKTDKATFITQNKNAIDKDFAGYKNVEKQRVMDENLFAELIYRVSKTNHFALRSLLEEYKLYNKSKDEVVHVLHDLITKSRLSNIQKSTQLLDSKPLSFFSQNDNFISFAEKINEVYAVLYQEMEGLNAEINSIIPRLTELKMELNQSEFIPDANSTLRFTYGYIKGYAPQDAIEYEPFTTLDGILQKNATGNADYFLEKKWIDKIKNTVASDNLKHPKYDSVVVCMLYNMDTTGGNSGSPILNSKGELIGVNFDRAYTATINDYAWNENYSRSIGVDIRYVLYNMKYFGKAEELLSEMKVQF